MKKPFSILFFLLAFVSFAHAQNSVTGVVTDAADNHPLVGASVFINGGSKGTVTDKDGQFAIDNISSNSFELIISYVSYETMNIKIGPDNIGKRFKIGMSPKENQLQEVVVGAVDKDGWKKYGAMFTRLFVGSSANAQKCYILNPDVLRFRYNKKTNVLRVYSVDKLMVKNPALGYTIQYQLEEFVYDSRHHMITYMGYTTFTPMESGREKKMNKWDAERRNVYEGSLMHFIRSLYANKVHEEGFEMTQLIRLYKSDSVTAGIYRKVMNGDYTGVDTGNFAIQIMKPSGMSLAPPIIYVIGKKPLPTDSIRGVDSSRNLVYASFQNCLQLTYKGLEKDEFVKEMYPMRKTRGPQSSILYLTNRPAIVIEKNGLYFEPLDLFSEGYIAWQKLAEMLPTDYDPAN